MDSFKNLDKPAVKIRQIWLEYNDSPSWEMYYCSRCRMPIMQYQGNMVKEIPGEADIKPTTLVLCKNPTCGIKYQFIAFIYRV